MVPDGWSCIGRKCFMMYTHPLECLLSCSWRDFPTWEQAHEYCENLSSVDVNNTVIEPSLLLVESDAEFQVVRDMISGQSYFLAVNCNDESTAGEWTCTKNSGQSTGLTRGIHS